MPARSASARIQEASFLVVESGRVRFFVRPRVDIEVPRSIDDVQRFVFTLAPRNQGQVRRLSIGKKRMPDDRLRERHWTYVDRVGSAAEVVSDLGPRRYTTKTHGLRHQAGLIEVASGTYAITLHRDHAHLMYELAQENDAMGPSDLLRQLGLAVRASYIAVVFNPESKWAARDREEERTPFSEPIDDGLKDKFDHRRYVPLDPFYLEHQGTELVLIGGGQSEDFSHASRTRS